MFVNGLYAMWHDESDYVSGRTSTCLCWSSWYPYSSNDITIPAHARATTHLRYDWALLFTSTDNAPRRGFTQCNARKEKYARNAADVTAKTQGESGRLHQLGYTPFTRWSKREANVFNTHVHDVCFKFASSCKGGTTWIETPLNSYCLMGCLHDPANVQQTSSKCIQNTLANAGRLLDCVDTS